MADKKQEENKEKKKQEAVVNQAPVSPEITKLDEVLRRLRLLEERYSSLRKKAQFTEHNMLKDAKEISTEIKTLSSTISELKNEISDLNEKMTKLSTEVSQGVSKAEFNVLAKYLDFWQPMDFLTRKEAEEMLKHKPSEE